MKFAFLVMLELRCIDKTIEKLYKNIIDYYNADIFILCQNLPNGENGIDMFDKNVIIKQLS